MKLNEIKELVGANELLLAQTVGSVSYGALQPKDEDIVLIVDKKTKARHFEEKKDYFVFTFDEYKKSILGEAGGFLFPLLDLCSPLNNEAAKTNHNSLVHYGESEFKKFSFFDNHKKVFQRVVSFGDRNFFSPHIRNARGKQGCGRMMTWALWYYYAFQNGSLELTKEQQNTIQLCHDGNLPIERARQLREKIMGIING